MVASSMMGQWAVSAPLPLRSPLPSPPSSYAPTPCCSRDLLQHHLQVLVVVQHKDVAPQPQGTGSATQRHDVVGNLPGQRCGVV